MTKEKLMDLIKYLEDIKSKLTSPVPPKHSNRAESYKAFLKNELRLVTPKIEAGKLTVSEEKK